MLGAVIYAKDLERLVGFYCCFGFEVVKTEPGDYAVLAGADGDLSIVKIPEQIAAGIEISEPPEVRGSSPIGSALSWGMSTVWPLEKEKANWVRTFCTHSDDSRAASLSQLSI